MSKQRPMITTEAVAIYRRLNPGADTHVTVEATQDLGGWVIGTGVQEVIHPNLSAIQQYLDEGYQLDTADKWVFVGVQRAPVTQIPMAAPPPTLRVTLAKPDEGTAKLSAVVSEYLTALANGTMKQASKKDNTVASRKSNLNTFMAYAGTNTTIEDAIDQVEAFSEHALQTRKNSKDTVNKKMDNLNLFFVWAKGKGYVSRLPDFTRCKKSDAERLAKGNRIYTEEELQLIFDYFEEYRLKCSEPSFRKHEGRKDRRKNTVSLAYLLLILLYTGFRKKELLSLEHSDILYPEGIQTFALLPENIDRFKNINSVRHIPVHHKVKELYLDQFLHLTKDTGKLFALEYYNYRKRFNDMLYLLGIKKNNYECLFHSIRSVFDTQLDHYDVAETMRRTVMGHAKSGMDSIYIQWVDKKIIKYNDEIQKLDYEGLDMSKFKNYLREELEFLYGVTV